MGLDLMTFHYDTLPPQTLEEGELDERLLSAIEHAG